MMSCTWSPWPTLTTASQATVISTQFLPEPLWQSVTLDCTLPRLCGSASRSLQPEASSAMFSAVRFWPA